MAHKISSLYINIKETQSIYKYTQCPEPMTSLTTKQSHPFIHKTRTENIQKQPFISKYIVATTTLRCIKFHKKNLKINKLRLNRTLLAHGMTNLTILLHKRKLIYASMLIDSVLPKTCQTSYSFSPRS